MQKQTNIRAQLWYSPILNYLSLTEDEDSDEDGEEGGSKIASVSLLLKHLTSKQWWTICNQKYSLVAVMMNIIIY